MDWTEDAILRIRQLWDEGLSTAEIGRRLGVSKNSVVGKAHRLDLPARPSPIRREPAAANAAQAAARPAVRRFSGPTLPSLATPAPLPVPPGTAPRPAVPHASPPTATARPTTRPSLVAAMAAPVRLSPRAPACCWPIGEPGTPTFRFCGEAALANKPYCGPHADIAYVRVRDRRDEVA